jgi:hypothetical protein
MSNMYIRLSDSDGQYSIHDAQEERPDGYDDVSEGWVSIPAAVFRGWQAINDQVSVYQALFQKLDNELWEREKKP